jgi:hypothetical protein
MRMHAVPTFTGDTITGLYFIREPQTAKDNPVSWQDEQILFWFHRAMKYRQMLIEAGIVPHDLVIPPEFVSQAAQIGD